MTSGITTKKMPSWLRLATSASSKSSLSVQDSPVHLLRRQWPNLVTKLMFLLSMIHRVVRTQLLHKVESTRPRIIRVTATAFIVCSTTPSKVETSVHVKPTCIAWLKYRSTSSTRWLRKVCLLLANTVDCLTTVHSVAHKSVVRSTRVARPVSNCCSVLTSNLLAKLVLAMCACSIAPNSLTSSPSKVVAPAL